MAEAQVFWEFELFVVGENPKAKLTYDNLKKLCEEYLRNNCKITVHDLTKNPELTKEHEITAIPTVIRRIPLPKKTLIGDLSNTDKAVSRLELKREKRTSI